MRSYLGRRSAGFWIVNNGKTGVVYIGIVHLTDADRRYAQSHIHMGMHASFALVNETYSLSQLTTFQSVVDKYVERASSKAILRQHPYASIGVSPENNAVEFGVPKADAAFWLPKIQPLLPYDALVVRYGAPPVADKAD
jgi:hypothetical protein